MSIRIPYLVFILLTGTILLDWLQSREHPLPEDVMPLPRASMISSYREAVENPLPDRRAGHSWGTTLDARSGDR